MSLEQFNEHVYDQFYNPNAAPPVNDIYLSHQLGLMFMVLAIGSLMDIKRQAYNIEAEKYHMLSRAALFQSPIFEQPTISAVQALVSGVAEHLLYCLLNALIDRRSILWHFTCSCLNDMGVASGHDGRSWVLP